MSLAPSTKQHSIAGGCTCSMQRHLVLRHRPEQPLKAEDITERQKPHSKQQVAAAYSCRKWSLWCTKGTKTNSAQLLTRFVWSSPLMACSFLDINIIYLSLLFSNMHNIQHSVYKRETHTPPKSKENKQTNQNQKPTLKRESNQQKQTQKWPRCWDLKKGTFK